MEVMPEPEAEVEHPVFGCCPSAGVTPGSLSIQPPFQAENSSAYVGAPPLSGVYPYWPYWLFQGDLPQVWWSPWQLPYLNVGNLNVGLPLSSAVAQPDFGEAESVTEIQEYRSACACPSKTRIVIDAPTEDDEAFLPMESVINGGPKIYTLSHSGASITMRRKVAKRTRLSLDLEGGELNLAAPYSPPPLQDEDILATKRRRLDSIMTSKVATTDLSDDCKPNAKGHSSPTETILGTSAISYLLGKKRTPTNAASPNATMALPPPSPPADVDVYDDVDDRVHGDDGDDGDKYVDDNGYANTDSVTDAQSKNHLKAAGATHSGHWTSEEDAELTSAVAKTYKKKWGKECRKDWVAVAALVPGRTKEQCWNRWNSYLHPSIDRTGRKGLWTTDEDSKLRHAVQMQDGKESNDWIAVAALVPGRTGKQCWNRWYSYLNPSIDRTNGRGGKWTEDEDDKLKGAVKVHGGNDWATIAALVPNRTKKQCRRRWMDALNPNIKLTAGRTGPWTASEDIKLKGVVHTHGGKDWIAIAALIPGRTKIQCSRRWHATLKHSIDQTPERTVIRSTC
jgi:hypothetical protein